MVGIRRFAASPSRAVVQHGWSEGGFQGSHASPKLIWLGRKDELPMLINGVPVVVVGWPDDECSGPHRRGRKLLRPPCALPGPRLRRGFCFAMNFHQLSAEHLAAILTMLRTACQFHRYLQRACVHGQKQGGALFRERFRLAFLCSAKKRLLGPANGPTTRKLVVRGASPRNIIPDFRVAEKKDRKKKGCGERKTMCSLANAE